MYIPILWDVSAAFLLWSQEAIVQSSLNLFHGRIQVPNGLLQVYYQHFSISYAL
jgi:hypothetical protein